MAQGWRLSLPRMVIRIVGTPAGRRMPYQWWCGQLQEPHPQEWDSEEAGQEDFL